MTRRLPAAVASAALALGLASCVGSGTDPVTEPPPTVDIGGGPSDGGGDGPSDGGGEETDVAAPDVPEPDPADFPGMDERTPEGAEQATRYFIAMLFWGYQTGESDTFERLFEDTCGTCANNIEYIEQLQGVDTYWTEVHIEDVILESEEEAEGYDIGVAYGINIPARTEPDLEEGGLKSEDATYYSFAFGLDWIDGRWMINQYIIRAEDA